MTGTMRTIAVGVLVTLVASCAAAARKTESAGPSTAVAQQPAGPPNDSDAAGRTGSGTTNLIEQNQTATQAVDVRSLPGVDLKRDWFDYLPTVLGVLTVLIAAVAGFVSYKAFDDQRNAVRLTQRADVLIDTIATSTTGPLTDATVVTVKFKNFGPTRADRLVLAISIGIKKEPAVPAPRRELPVPSLASTDTQSYEFEPITRILTQDELNGVNAGILTLQILGELTYRDVFQQAHPFRFELHWNKEVSVFAMVAYDAS